MKLGIFFAIGSSFADQVKTGQDKRFTEYYLKRYLDSFEKIFIFSYKKEKFELPKNCILIANRFSLGRFLYSLLTPFLNWRTIKDIDVFRVMQLTGTVPAILSRIFFKKPFVFTYGYDYAAFARLEGQKIRPILLKVLEKLAIKFASGVIVTNKQIVSYLNKEYPQANLIYIPNGVDIEKFKIKSEKLKITIKNSKLIKLLFVGRLERQKNLESLIKAVSMLNGDYKIKLIFIGQGKLKLQLIKLAKKIGIDLKIVDKVPHDQMPKYYQQADIFVLPSFLEGHPKALLEAMVCGLPCLVGRYPGVEEFKNKKEILITGFTTGEIVKNLIELVKNSSLRKNLALQARKKIEKDFNLEKLLNKEINVLKNI